MKGIWRKIVIGAKTKTKEIEMTHYVHNKTYKLALFQRVQYNDWISLFEYTRCSEPLEVIFTSIPESTVITGEALELHRRYIAGLDKVIEETMAQAMETVMALREKKAELLALTFDPQRIEETPQSLVDDDIPF
jgi:hypothetical protein